MSQRPLRIATRARLFLGGTVTLALIVAFGAFWAAWSAYAVEQRTQELSRQVRALAAGISVAEQAGGSQAASERLFRVQGGLIGAQLLVVGADGAVERASSETSLTRVPLGRLKDRDAQGVATAVLGQGLAGRAIVVAAPAGGARTLVAVQGLAEVRAAQTGMLSVAFVAVLVALLVTWVSAGIFARRLTGPMVRLGDAARRVAAGEWGARVAVEGDVETRSVADSFNAMSTRVADAYRAQKSFVGDVSHEIRTPLTSIRGYTEALLDGTITDEGGRQRALGVIRDEAERIGETAHTLLALAELDSGAIGIARVPIDMGLLGTALRARFEAPALAAGVRLSVSLGDEVPLGDPDRLLQASSALVDNALRHASGAVHVRSAAAPGGWRLTVDDDGPGVPVPDRDSVFDRFRRLDASRSSASGGAGLGLSISRRLVELQGGTVGVEDGDLSGARFFIELPMST